MPPSTPAPGPAEAPSAVVRRVRTAMTELTVPFDSRISPDGHRVAVSVLGPFGTDVLIAPADGPALPLPTAPPGPATGSRHTPRWLPDSRTLLLVTEPAGPGLPLLTAWDTLTGVRRELAAVPGAVEDLYVSDDGAEVLLLTADDGAERDGMNLGLPVRLGPAPAPASYRPDTGWRRLLHGLLPPAGAPTGGAPSAAPGRPVVLRDRGPVGLTVWNAAWRGGPTVVATVSEDPLPAGYYHARLVRIDLTDGRAVTLHEPRGQLAAPALSRDGHRAAVAEGISIVAGRPLLVSLTEKTVTPVPGAEDVTWIQFHPRDTDRLLTAGRSGTGTRVADVRADGASRSGPAHGPAVLHEEQAVLSGAGAQPALSLSADGLTAATVREAPGVPPQAVVAPTTGPQAWNWRPVTAPDRVAAHQDGGHEDLARVRTRQTTWTAPDGTPVHGLVLDAPGTPAPVRPAAGTDTDPVAGTGPGSAAEVPGPDRPADARATPAAGAGTAGPARPLAVLLHGGPSWQWSAGYAPADVLGLAPALAAAGWLVLLPNPRGSSGYGLDHARAVVGACGDGDLDDVLSGVAHLTRRGEALPGRAAVLGHSYGGFLAALAAARTDAFRAAVVVSAPTDWLSFAHTSVIGGGYERTYAIGDARTPEGRAALTDRSPVFADGGSRTPVLVLHGEHDRVTPPGQAHELYRALSGRATAPVELHVYPDEGHEFTGPSHLLDAAARAEDWLARYVAPQAAPRDRTAHHPRPQGQDAGPGTGVATGTGPKGAP
ncbi:alpha/beta fold hydrolase [Streptomyces sp. NPDC058008]|uniref:S9 family peptidase n=1 Tax=Streptomyces sp. NPDC058008 TaxID=3346303 RepID=UPI0036E508DA